MVDIFENKKEVVSMIRKELNREKESNDSLSDESFDIDTFFITQQFFSNLIEYNEKEFIDYFEDFVKQVNNEKSLLTNDEVIFLIKKFLNNKEIKTVKDFIFDLGGYTYCILNEYGIELYTKKIYSFLKLYRPDFFVLLLNLKNKNSFDIQRVISLPTINNLKNYLKNNFGVHWTIKKSLKDIEKIKKSINIPKSEYYLIINGVIKKEDVNIYNTLFKNLNYPEDAEITTFENKDVTTTKILLQIVKEKGFEMANIKSKKPIVIKT